MEKGLKAWGTAAWVGTSSNKDTIRVDPEEAERARLAREWNGMEDVGRMQVHSQRLGIQKTVLDGQIALKQMEKDYPYEFAVPAPRSPWFHPIMIGICLLQLLLLLVVVAHLSRPTLPVELGKTDSPDSPSTPLARKGRAAR